MHDEATPARTLDRYDYYRGPKALADEWTVTRGQLGMRCALSTHRLGWELRLTAGSNFLRSQVCKTQTEVFETSAAWRAEAISKGWTWDPQRRATGNN
jgi:hypothetical protein